MRYAIVESGGKQYRAVEGGTIDVDRLPVEAGKQFDLDHILFMGDGDEVLVGTPTVNGIRVTATVLAHVKGPKVVSFKYRPKKRIRVKGGHRQQYTRLMVDFIGKPGEKRKVEKVEEPVVEQEAEVKVAVETAPKAEKQARATKEAVAKSTTKKAAPAKKSTAKSSEKKSTTTKKTTKK
ncbi:MAG TPA: 50S ribosomal protein L21 [Anaerolineales bacterium]|nr:50S ribosomal protein L21 [Anaerolineales bacterium]